MNNVKRLALELDGIEGIIKEYTKDPIICNYLLTLKAAVKNADYEAIKYCLTKIYSWYENSISFISSNGFVNNVASHHSAMQMIKEFIERISLDDCSEIHAEYVSEEHTPVIFISHKSDDKKYGDALRDFIVGLGVKDNQLIYTSHPLHKISMDANIFDYLRDHINSKIFMIILWSDRYLDSPACLNEMGAAWVLKADYTNIYVPEFSFGNPKYHECAVDTRKMGAVLNGDQHCKASMIELKNKIQAFFGLQNDEQKSGYLLDEFICSITKK